MADTKISDLTEHTAPIATDLLPVVDVTGGETKNIQLGTITPAGGTAGQVLAKASGDDFDKEWITPYSPKLALFYIRGTNGVDPTGASIVNGNPLKYDQELFNNISGLTRTTESGYVWKTTTPYYLAATTSTYEFPVGTYLIHATFVPYYAGRVRLFIRDHDTNTLLHGGPSISVNTGDGTTLELTYPLVVTGLAKKVSFEFTKTNSGSSVLSLHDNIAPTAVLYENFGELLIQKIV